MSKPRTITVICAGCARLVQAPVNTNVMIHYFCNECRKSGRESSK